MLPQDLLRIVLTYLSSDTLLRLPRRAPIIRKEIHHRPPMEIVLTLYPKFKAHDYELPYKGWTLKFLQHNWEKIGTRRQLFRLCSTPDVDIDIIRAHTKILNWAQLSRYWRWTMDTLAEFEGYVNWSVIESNPYFKPEMLKKYQDRMNWDFFSRIYPFTCEELEQYQDCVNWFSLSFNCCLNIDILNRFQRKLQWGIINRYFVYPSVLLDRYQERISWLEFSANKNLTLAEVERCKDKIHWPALAANVTDVNILLKYCPDNILYSECRWDKFSAELTLTSEFLLKFENHLHWYIISSNPSLTLKMIQRWSEKIHWGQLSAKGRVTVEVLELYQDKIDFIGLSSNLYFGFLLKENKKRLVNFINLHREKWDWKELSYLILRYEWEIILDHPEWPWVWK